MNCPQCFHPIRANDNYCSQCGCHLETGRLPVAQIKDIDKAVTQLEQRLKGRTSYVPSANDGFVLFRIGSVLAAIFMVHFFLRFVPYRPPYDVVLWWAETILLLAEMAVPVWMAIKIPQNRYRIVLLAIGILVFGLGIYRVLAPFV